MTVFETPRLLVRQYNTSDANYFFMLNGNEEVSRYIRPVLSREESDKFLQQNIAFYQTHPNLGRWAAIEKVSNRFVGSCAIIPIEQEREKLQIGYALLPDEWGKGFATELVEFGKKFFFSNHDKDILYAITEQPNFLSQKVLIKAGFQQDGFMREGEKELFRFCLHRAQ